MQIRVRWKNILASRCKTYNLC